MCLGNLKAHTKSEQSENHNCARTISHSNFSFCFLALLFALKTYSEYKLCKVSFRAWWNMRAEGRAVRGMKKECLDVIYRAERNEAASRSKAYVSACCAERRGNAEANFEKIFTRHISIKHNQHESN